MAKRIPKPTKEEMQKLADTMSGVDIAKILNVNHRTVYKWFKTFEIKAKGPKYWADNYKTYDYNHNIFLNEDAISYYLLGAYMTDGCIKNNCVSLSSADKDWLEIIRDLICKDLPLQKEPSKCWRLNIHDAKIKDWLISKGCTPRKSLTLKFPDVPEQYLPDFIRGCWDGDGSISFAKYTRIIQYKNGPKPYIFNNITSTITSASRSFIDELIQQLNIKNIPYCLIESKIRSKNSIIDGREIIQKNTYWSISNGHNSTRKLLEWIYYPSHFISMPRKYKKAQEIFNYYHEKEKDSQVPGPVV